VTATVVRRDRASPAALAVVSVAAWLTVVAVSGADTSDLVPYLAAWTVMMVAMMLPSAAPLVLLYRRGASVAATARLVAGYLAVWAAVGVAAWTVDMEAPEAPTAVVLAAVGTYQLLPLKHACLRRCRSPVDYLAQRWRRSALRLGVEHGLWCLGCCWALMALVVLVGMMSLVWVVGVAALVAIEKLTALGPQVARRSGLVLIALALWEGVT